MELSQKFADQYDYKILKEIMEKMAEHATVLEEGGYDGHEHFHTVAEAIDDFLVEFAPHCR